jgi:hypothetical protein
MSWPSPDRQYQDQCVFDTRNLPVVPGVQLRYLCENVAAVLRRQNPVDRVGEGPLRFGLHGPK